MTYTVRTGRSTLIAFLTSVVLLTCVTHGRAATPDADAARQALRDAFDQSTGWVNVHAADALNAIGEGQRVRAKYVPMEATPLPADAPLGLRVGILRGLAGAAAGADREAYVEKIRQIALDAASPDRLHSVETLAKLGHAPSAEDRKTFTDVAKSAEPAVAPLAWWLLAGQGTGAERATAKAEIVKLVATPEPLARMRAAYALRHLGGLRDWEWVRIAEQVVKGQDDLLAEAYLASTAYVLSPSEDSVGRYKARVVKLARKGTPPQRYEVAHALGVRGSADDLPLLRELLAHDDTDIRIAAAAAILAIESRQGQAGPAPSRPVARPLSPADGVTFVQDVAFLPPGRIEKLDLYLPANRPAGTRSPAVVMIHGGGWLGGDKAGGREYSVGVTLAQAGYVYASVNYQLDPSDRWPTNLLDCKNAVRFLRANAEKYGVDPDRIGVIGSSAGGHLALMVAYTAGTGEFEPEAPYAGVSSHVSAVVNLFGITDIAAWMTTDTTGQPPKPKGPS